MSTTVNHVGSEREWKGNLEQWGKHKECIIHWCDGVGVEVFNDIKKEWCLMINGIFSVNFKYRKKQREPKSGEVWEESRWYPWIKIEDVNGNFNGWVSVDGCNVRKSPEPENLKFIASSLGEYYSK